MNLEIALPFTSATLAAILAILGLIPAQRTVARWAFAAGMLNLATASLLVGLEAQGDPSPGALVHWQTWRLVNLSLVPGIWLLFAVTYSRGDLKPWMRRWRWPLAAAILLPPAFALTFRSDLVYVMASPEEWHLRLGWAALLIHAWVLAGSVLILMNLERTYRGSVGTMRWRIKYMLMGVGLIFVVRLYASSQVLLFPTGVPLLQVVNSGALLVACLFFFRSLLRDREFNLDVYPSQSVLSNSLTALLAGVYLVLVGVFAKLVSYWGGDATFALKALFALVSLVLLGLLIQSDKLRLRLRRFVSRNFQRPMYDYRRTWKTFTEGTAPCVDQGDLCRALVRLIAELFSTLSVSIWLHDERQGRLFLAASTSLADGSSAQPTAAESALLLDHFKSRPDPVDYESSTAPWAEALRRWQPSEFTKGGHRIGVPIIGRGHVLGVITLGDRVGGLEYTLQDFEMLQCACDHAAAHLLNVQLSQQLMQARELEAFQAMAAFFVHDLKNAASTLNLMLQNLPEHYDDPAFRADALRGIGNTVAHVNQLVGRLTQLRQQLKIQPAPTDLNAVVTKAVAGLETGPDFTLTRKLEPLPPLTIDGEQIGKVVTNLVLNAREAAQGRGEVHLATARANGSAVITVRDNGCGMSADFIERSLFRPFQTTKKSGLGIGMFQSKTIVEAHGGRIAVTSEPGRGTTFQVFLPLA